jgi:hypothetical protein
VHSATHKTPFEGWHGQKPDIAHLKMFGSCVCVKHTGSRRCKLDRHNFTGIFLGYTVTDQNIIYLDTSSGVIKSCHHAVFDEAWYLQSTQPPAAQLLYDLGLEAETSFVTHDGPLHLMPDGTISPIAVPWPPSFLVPHKLSKPPPFSLLAPLPLRLMATPNIIAASAARVQVPDNGKTLVLDIVTEYLIRPHDMAMIYMSLDPYGCAFEQEIDLRKWDLTKHRTAGMCLLEKNGRLLLASIDAGTPAARINHWRTHMWGAWLVSINGTTVRTIADVEWVLARLTMNTHPCVLVFSHPETSPNISNKGLPIMCKEDFSQFTHDQLNNRLDLMADGPIFCRGRRYDIVESGDVNNYTT